ncbi:hypothetical protein WN55_01669 [Dufourea novaeangliae]|uniref:Uncharacterized protein n=1 Tax=Dufourea novaeangliae TaxID=178035 RepID=A0A154PGI4_DUFNO|nr:hypothetical protein WN55_01669 [Dufourea novaeangliae]
MAMMTAANFLDIADTPITQTDISRPRCIQCNFAYCPLETDPSRNENDTEEMKTKERLRSPLMSIDIGSERIHAIHPIPVTNDKEKQKRSRSRTMWHVNVGIHDVTLSPYCVLIVANLPNSSTRFASESLVTPSILPQAEARKRDNVLETTKTVVEEITRQEPKEANSYDELSKKSGKKLERTGKGIIRRIKTGSRKVVLGVKTGSSGSENDRTLHKVRSKMLQNREHLSRAIEKKPHGKQNIPENPFPKSSATTSQVGKDAGVAVVFHGGKLGQFASTSVYRNFLLRNSEAATRHTGYTSNPVTWKRLASLARKSRRAIKQAEPFAPRNKCVPYSESS